MIDLAGLDRTTLTETARAQIGRGHGRSAQIFKQVMQHGRFAPEDTVLGEAAISRWRAVFELSLPKVQQVIDEPFPSEVDGASTAKAILTLHDGKQIEMVRIPMGRDRHTLCLSSQVGCKRACTFCETGRMGLIRQLSAGEIISQYLVATHQLEWIIRNVVFMGMGEAFDNWGAVLPALRILNDRSGIGMSQERMTVCTVGNIPGIEALKASNLRRVGLSLSLNAANDELRTKIMPIAKVHPLADVQQALMAYRPRKNFAFGINYCLMPGINDYAGAEQEVASFVEPLGRTLVNVIPYNPGTDALCPPPSEDAINDFCHRLRAAGCAVRKRITKGRTVMAACGQLGDISQRRRR